jgi:hypothetical protein
MNSAQQTRLEVLSTQAQALSNELEVGVALSPLYLISEQKAAQPVVIAGNREGLLYLASVCLRLAKERSEQQHQHFDDAGVLSQCEQPFVVKFQSSPTAQARSE